MASKEPRARRGWVHRFFPPRRRKQIDEDIISVRTLQMMDTAMENFREGKAGPVVDPDRLRRLAS